METIIGDSIGTTIGIHSLPTKHQTVYTHPTSKTLNSKSHALSLGFRVLYRGFA